MGALDDVAFLADSPNRVAALDALAESSLERGELQSAIGVSRSTVKRVLAGFLARGWAVKEGRRYALTPVGALVASRFRSLLETMTASERLREAARWLPTAVPDFDVELFADATVTTAELDAPYRPLERLMRLIERSETETVRSFGTRLPAGYFDALDWRVRDEREVEVLFSSEVLGAFLESTTADAVDAVANEQLSIRVHDSLPCGLTLLDDHVAVCGYDPKTGMLQALVDTTDPDAVEWGRTTYETYRRESTPVDPSGVSDIT